MVNSGKCLGVWFAPPCSSWSTSRRNDGNKAAAPLRDPSNVLGLPGLPPNDKRKVDEANKLVERTVMLALNCILQKVPFAIENPYHSPMWMVPGMKHIISLPGVTCTRVDFCQFGEKYHKKTKLVSYDFDIQSISKVCKTRNGICSRSGEPHELLSGAVECPMTSFTCLTIRFEPEL